MTKGVPSHRGALRARLPVHRFDTARQAENARKIFRGSNGLAGDNYSCQFVSIRGNS
jgi:hypothetical protein